MNDSIAIEGSNSEEAAKTESNFEFGGRWVFILVTLLALAIVSTTRLEVQSRTQGPLIADSIEYLTMAKHVTEGTSLAVKPVRSGLFSLMLAVPLWIQKSLAGEADSTASIGTEEPSVALSVLLLFNLLSILGSYRLGLRLRGSWTGLLAAFFVAMLPEFTRWSLDYLTDIPAAAFGIWALVFWVERKPFRVGLMLGLAVAVRYQCLIPLGAFFLVPLLLRRWKDLSQMFLGLVPAIVILGAVDYFYWEEAFHTFMLFVPRQLTTFLPAELISKIFPTEATATMPAVEVNHAIEAIVAKSKFWYFEQAAGLFSLALLYPILLYPIARRSLRSRSGADMTLWITAFSLLILSAQRYKETRYLVAIIPMLSVLSAVGVMWVVGIGTKLLGSKTWIASVVGLFMMYIVVESFIGTTQKIQRRLQMKPYGSLVDAVDSIPMESRPCSIGMERRWLISKNHPVRRTGGFSWFSNDFALFELESVVRLFQSPPDLWEQLPMHETLKGLDYYVFPVPTTSGEVGRKRWINEHAVFDGYFFKYRQNEFGSMRFRSEAVTEDTAPFWYLDDSKAREGKALAKFAADVEFISVELEELPASEKGIKIDTRWRLPIFAGVQITAEIDVINSRGHKIASVPIWLFSEDAQGQSERSGVAFRDTKYVNLIVKPTEDQLEVGVRIIAVEAQSGAPVSQRMELPDTGEVLDGNAAQFKLSVPLKPSLQSPATPPPITLDTPPNG